MSVRTVTGTHFNDLQIERREEIEEGEWELVTRYYIRTGYMVLTEGGDTWGKGIEKKVPPAKEAKAAALFDIMQSLTDQEEGLA